MKKVKQYKRWGIYELNSKEKSEYGFGYAVIHPSIMESPHPWLEPSDTDMEMDSMESCMEWINNY